MKKPVVVLSSNDGCVVSRSNEAKALGFKMGAPYFTIRKQCDWHHVTVFSSNFDLYRDISRRVMHVIHQVSDDVEEYSIDEAFLRVSAPMGVHGGKEVPAWFIAQATHIRETVLREVGIPVSVGIASTKTLAKVATHLAKEAQKHDTLTPRIATCTKGVCVLVTQDAIADALTATPIEEVWGIGFRLAPKLRAAGIENATQLVAMKDVWVRARMSIVGVRTVHELRGVRCFSVGAPNGIRKSLLHSRSFGAPTNDVAILRAAVAYHARKVAEILRAEKVLARRVSVSIRTSQHRTEGNYMAHEEDILPTYTNDTFVLVRAARTILDRIYREGFLYVKAGVMVCDIVSEASLPCTTLFAEEVAPRDGLMHTLDTIRHMFGDVLRVGSEGSDAWYARHERLSPRYTTTWGDIARVQIAGDCEMERATHFSFST